MQKRACKALAHTETDRHRLENTKTPVNGAQISEMLFYYSGFRHAQAVFLENSARLSRLSACGLPFARLGSRGLPLL